MANVKEKKNAREYPYLLHATAVNGEMNGFVRAYAAVTERPVGWVTRAAYQKFMEFTRETDPALYDEIIARAAEFSEVGLIVDGAKPEA